MKNASRPMGFKYRFYNTLVDQWDSSTGSITH